MADSKRIVVIGGGLAGAKGVEALRAQGYEGALTLVADESDLPYERPPLSKDYLQDKTDFAKAIVHPAEWYEQHDVELRLSSAAMSIDRERHQVVLADGSVLPYDKLLLATGAIPRKLSLEHGDAAYYLRSHHDADVLKTFFGDDKHIVIIGAGWIGLEVAAAARNAGTRVTVVEAADLPLLAVLGKEMAEVFAALHRDHDVDLRLGATLDEITVNDDGVATGVVVDGESIEANAVIAGIGVAPEVSLAELAGLQVDNGVLVDPSLRTSDPDIYAVGDVANHDHPVLRRRVRVEHWANALNQPATAAAGMLGESNKPYDRLPYFFSDQYDLGMEYLGYAPKDSYAKVVVRGDTGEREFAAFWLDDENHILAVMNVNVWDVVDAIRPLIADRVPVDPERLQDPSIDWADLTQPAADQSDADQPEANASDDDESGKSEDADGDS